jgi:Cu-Zn family superoxide dismutase
MKHILAAALAIGFGGCASNSGGEALGPLPSGATADLRDASGASRGVATLAQVGDGVRVSVTGMNLPTGARGIHIHQVGVCAAPDFASAGPHWNPTSRQHGKDNPAGMHVGDLPNLLIGADGRGTMEFTIPDTSVAGGSRSILDTDGAAIVIHAAADDNRTDPSGSSGSRIACGVFR